MELFCSNHDSCEAGASSCFIVELNIYIQKCVMAGWVGDLLYSSASLCILKVNECCVS